MLTLVFFKLVLFMQDKISEERFSRAIIKIKIQAIDE